MSTAAEHAGTIKPAKRLTNRARRRLRKQLTKRERSWCDKFVDEGIKAYASAWEKVAEPPTPAVEKALRRVAERMVRRGEMDLRRMDRRFWEVLYSCQWNPMTADKTYWQGYAGRLRRRAEMDREQVVHGIRDRSPDDANAAATAAAYKAEPVRVSVYDWWIGLHKSQRDWLMVETAAINALEGPTERQKRRNEKSRPTSEWAA